MNGTLRRGSAASSARSGSVNAAKSSTMVEGVAQTLRGGLLEIAQDPVDAADINAGMAASDLVCPAPAGFVADEPRLLLGRQVSRGQHASSVARGDRALRAGETPARCPSGRGSRGPTGRRC